MKIYIACGLTHVPRNEFQNYVRFIHDLAHQLQSKRNASVKYALRDSDPQLAEKPIEERSRLCYLWDKEMVEWADVIIADVSYPSTGLGIELQIAENKNIPIILCFEKSETHKAPPVEYVTPDHARHSLQLGEGFVSLMALGLPSVFQIVPYVKSQAAYALLHDVLSLLEHKHLTKAI